MAELELNKIVSMIMENPELIAKIKAMGETKTENTVEEVAAESAGEPPKIEAPTFAPRRSKRNEILRSLESFLSEDRKKSLETMMTIADVLDSVRRKEN